MISLLAMILHGVGCVCVSLSILTKARPSCSQWLNRFGWLRNFPKGNDESFQSSFLQLIEHKTIFDYRRITANYCQEIWCHFALSNWGLQILFRCARDQISGFDLPDWLYSYQNCCPEYQNIEKLACSAELFDNWLHLQLRCKYLYSNVWRCRHQKQFPNDS